MRDLGPVFPPDATEGPPGTGGPSQPLGSFGFAGASADLSHVIFFDYSGPQWPGETSGPLEYALGRSGPPLPVALDDAGHLIDGGNCTVDAISAEGSRVLLSCEGQIYARVENGEPGARTVSISEPSHEDCAACDTGSPLPATYRGSSEDGSKVFFTTAQELLPDNPGANLYEYDFGAADPHERLSVLSAGAPGAQAPGFQGVTAVSRDGSHVYFTATAVLTAEPNGLGAQAVAGQENLYAYDTETAQTAFVASLPAGSSIESASATPDGRFLAFQSKADLTPDDTSSQPQVFRYAAATDGLLRVSVGQDGFAEDGNAGAFGATLSGGGRAHGSVAGSYRSFSISADGAAVAFTSPDGLTPAALDDLLIAEETTGGGGGSTTHRAYANNAYLWREGQVSLISDGQDASVVSSGSGAVSAVSGFGLSASGANAFLSTADALAPTDTDTAVDLYNARLEGGFPAPREEICSGEESCRPPPARPSAEPAPHQPSGEGNLVVEPCKKGYLRKGGRCVKHSRHKAHRKRRSQRAGHHRGGSR